MISLSARKWISVPQAVSPPTSRLALTLENNIILYIHVNFMVAV